jgi:putative endonuclease
VTDARKQLGARGESIAADYLKRLRYKILARNYACPLGEIDLIALDDGCIVFCEVKTLADDASADPEEKIDPAKQRKLRQIAEYWLRQHRQPECACRFDALAVVIPPGGEPTVRHIIEAFIPRY